MYRREPRIQGDAMDFIHHTLNWTRGEIFESSLIGLCGAFLIGAGFLFRKFGETPAAKAMFVPLLVFGGLLLATGIAGYISNTGRLTTYGNAYQENPATFVESEKQRVEDFQFLYTIVLVLAPLCFVVASALFWWTTGPTVRAIAITLVLFGLSGLIIDFFSKERADIYYEKILAELNRTTSAPPGLQER